SGNTAGDNNYDDYNDHGSHVAGIIGAVGNNGVGVTGINWNTKLISVRTFNAGGVSASDLSEIMAALNYIARLLKENPSLNLAAINMSMEAYVNISPSEMTKDVFYYGMKTLDDLDRCLIVVAAGNSGVEVGVPAASGSHYGQYVYPASLSGLDNMIVVTAVNSDLEIATTKDFSSGSNWSTSKVHLAAPGVNILSTVRDNGYKAMKGTSMAAPYVTGAAALLRSAFPNATTAQLKSALLGGATTRSALSPYVASGRLLNIAGALKTLSLAQPPTDAAVVAIDESASTKTASGYSNIVVKIASGGNSPQAGDLFYVWLKSSTSGEYVCYWTKVVTNGQLDISVSGLKNLSEATLAASISSGTYDILYRSDDKRFSGKILNVALAGTDSGGSGGGGGGCSTAAWPCAFLLALLWLRKKHAGIR
nr:S8 family serine peptidase [Fretibacterium sp.]